MRTSSTTLYDHVLVVGLPHEATQNEERLKERGVTFVSVDGLASKSDVPAGTELIAVYSPIEKGRSLLQQSVKSRINRIASDLEIQCNMISTVTALLGFLQTRLRKVGVQEMEMPASDRQFVESHMPEGYDFKIKPLAREIRQKAITAGLYKLATATIMAHLGRMIDERRRAAGAPNPEAIMRGSGARKREDTIRLGQLVEAQTITLPDDVITAAENCRSAGIEGFVRRLYRPDLGISDASYAKAIHALAVKNGFPGYEMVTVYRAFERVKKYVELHGGVRPMGRKKGHVPANKGKRTGAAAGSSPEA